MFELYVAPEKFKKYSAMAIFNWLLLNLLFLVTGMLHIFFHVFEKLNSVSNKRISVY